MPKLHVEALIFSLTWAALAVYGGVTAGFMAGAALSAGLLLIIMPTSALMLSKTGSFSLERQVRWGILTVAALAFGLISTFSR
jgi:hypothetical protein